MEKEITRQDKIDSYLLGRMNSADRIEFEAEIASDTELKDKVRLQKLIIDEINDRESFNRLLKNNEKNKIIKLQIWKVVSIAAVFTGLLGFFILQPTRIANEKIFEEYSVTFPVRISEVKDPVRGTEYALPGMSYDDYQNANNGLAYYNNQSYQKAIQSFETIDSLRKFPELALYMSISQLKVNKTDDAINTLEYLNDLRGFKFEEAVKYYLSIAYIQSGKILKARKLLRSLIKNQGDYHIESSEILSKMRWF